LWAAKCGIFEKYGLDVPAQLGRASDLLDTRLTQPTIDVCAKYNAIPKAFPVREMIDPSVFQP
jgi:hypothetical protein